MIGMNACGAGSALHGPYVLTADEVAAVAGGYKTVEVEIPFHVYAGITAAAMANNIVIFGTAGNGVAGAVTLTTVSMGLLDAWMSSRTNTRKSN